MKQRVVSAIVALIIVIPLVLLGGLWFDVGLFIISCIALRELKNVDKEKNNLIINIISYISLFIIILNDRINIDIQKSICLSIILLYLPIIFCDRELYNYKMASNLFSKVLLIGFSFNLMRIVRYDDIWLFLFLFVISTITDTAAYLVGYNFGKKHICPNVSPNKTLEGSLAGTISCIIISTIFYIYFVDPASNILTVLLGTLILSVIGQLGDLFFSQIKRTYGIKDFGNIMPGHGGVLDRLDSLIFITIGFFIITNLF